MMNTDHLCMSCMREIGDEEQCPYCGFHADSPQLAPYLPLRTAVSERYLAGKLAGRFQAAKIGKSKKKEGRIYNYL